MSEPAQQTAPHRTVRLAAVVAAAEGVALLGFAVYFAVQLLVSTPADGGLAVGALALEAFGGVLLLLIARGIDRRRGWARSPSIVLQLLSLPVGYTLAFQADQPWWGFPVLVAAVGELYLLMTPEARLAFEHRA